MMEISPKYQMELASKVNAQIWSVYDSYRNVLFYIEKWHEVDERNDWENFAIYTKMNKESIDLEKTLHRIDGELLIKIAIDMGITTPDFIPAFPTFKNEIKSDYNTSYQSFEKAVKNIEEDPDLAVGLANSTW